MSRYFLFIIFIAVVGALLTLWFVPIMAWVKRVHDRIYTRYSRSMRKRK